ncbi:unnamed protein product [Boreogadus saida]
MGLEGATTPARAGKKWENLKKTYKPGEKAPGLLQGPPLIPVERPLGLQQRVEGTGPAKGQRTDPVLEFLEAQTARAEERARREEEREERLLSLLEKIVDKM